MKFGWANLRRGAGPADRASESVPPPEAPSGERYGRLRLPWPSLRRRRALIAALAGASLVAGGVVPLAARAVGSHDQTAPVGILVPATTTAPGTDTGVRVTEGDQLQISGYGTAQYGVDTCGSDEGTVEVTTAPDGTRTDASANSC